MDRHYHQGYRNLPNARTPSCMSLEKTCPILRNLFKFLGWQLFSFFLTIGNHNHSCHTFTWGENRWSSSFNPQLLYRVLYLQIPHEFGNLAILLKSGFDRCHKTKHWNIFQSNRRTKQKKTMIRWEAARAQISTALVGLLGPSWRSPLRAAMIWRHCSCEKIIHL